MTRTASVLPITAFMEETWSAALLGLTGSEGVLALARTALIFAVVGRGHG